MSNTYKWSVKKMTAHTNLNNFENVIYSVVWGCSATSEEDLVVETSGTQEIEFVNNGNFMPVNELTEQIVVGWVKSSMGNEAQISIKSQLDFQLEDLKTPKNIDVVLPWAIAEA
jgi:hypothetical protein